MLIELFGKNFGSFRDDFLLSFLPSDIDESTEGLVSVDLADDDKPLWLLRAIGIYGPNASGKSTIIRSAGALAHFLSGSANFSSDKSLAPYEPFALDKASGSKPVELGVRAVVDGRVYLYSISFDRDKFISESLIECGRDEQVILFDRHGSSVHGQWTEAPRFSLLLESFRPNALLLSLADRFTPDLAKNISVGLNRLLNSTDPRNWSPTWWRPGVRSFIASKIAEDEKFASWLVKLLQHADTGIVAHRTEEIGSDLEADDDAPSDGTNKSKKYRVSFVHSGTDGEYEVKYARESAGTQKAVDLAWYLYMISHESNVRSYFIDEIGSSLHPILVSSLIRDFNRHLPYDKVVGQLIFATHETSLVDGEARNAVLRRDQVYFTEKDRHGVSKVFGLSEFGERSNLNIRKRYLQGRYGAIPNSDIIFE